MLTEAEVRARLDEVEADERLFYQAANVVINAPLALEQVALEVRSDTLREVLGLPGGEYLRRRKRPLPSIEKAGS
jgi:hypothetical protein